VPEASGWHSVSVMCGRFTSTTEPADLAAYFAADHAAAPDLGARYNVAPTDEVYAVVASGDERRLGAVRWGLVPFWADDLSVGSRMINARAETLVEKPAFARPFANRRCLIPADGFYEWQPLGPVDPGRRSRPKKQPWYIRRSDGDVLAFAGLWESWRPRPAHGDRDGRVVSCTIITTSANGRIRPLHDRMPVVLPPSAWDAWLDRDNHDVASLQRLLEPAPAELFDLVPVSAAVSDVRNDGPGLIERVPPPEVQPTLS
jgi:putative SOS response-associated peptidase YedK